MTDVLVDTDVWIYHLRGHLEIRTRGRRLFVSSISRAELSSGVSAAAEAGAIRSLLSAAPEIAVGLRELNSAAKCGDNRGCGYRTL